MSIVFCLALVDCLNAQINFVFPVADRTSCVALLDPCRSKSDQWCPASHHFCTVLVATPCWSLVNKEVFIALQPHDEWDKPCPQIQFRAGLGQLESYKSACHEFVTSLMMNTECLQAVCVAQKLHHGILSTWNSMLMLVVDNCGMGCTVKNTTLGWCAIITLVSPMFPQSNKKVSSKAGNW